MSSVNLQSNFTNTVTAGAASPGVAQPDVENIGVSKLYTGGGKRVFDLVIVVLTLPLTLPLILLGALALWIEGGNPFYQQDRLGRDGTVFRLKKLRTMTRTAQEDLAKILETDPVLRHEWITTQKLKKDPRITRVGQFLRSTSLDELPQIWNVLTGEMSIVGPRPMMPDQLELYGDPRAYFAMRPGLSGLWQIRERNNSHFSYRAGIHSHFGWTSRFFGRRSLSCCAGPDIK
jgi:lipopolysaccharide/colanic/teichoic acid biosynthesis glycosyltransferase